MEYVEKGLAARGYRFDRAAIEAAVTQLRSDTCAYLKDLNMEVAGDEDVWISETQGGTQIPAGTAAQATGKGTVSGAEAAIAQRIARKKRMKQEKKMKRSTRRPFRVGRNENAVPCGRSARNCIF